MTLFDDPRPDEAESAEHYVWSPTPKQSEFLAAPEYEVLYGGAAGGGKSDALLIDAWCLQHNGPNNKNHRAIIFRRTYKDLSDLIDRGNEIFPQFIPGVTYNANERCFETPAGAKLYLSHLQHDKHRYNHRGRAYNWIGFDELTLWSTPKCWEYLQSRNRTTDKTLPCYMRATTNPDGPGQKWVMDRFGIEEEGKATRLETVVETEVLDEATGEWTLVPVAYVRRFIPAKLVDNPHLRGTGYRERLMLMPREESEALLRGLWRGNRVEGAYYYKEMQWARANGRICRVPHQKGTPVNTYWDLGWNDCTAIWFHQAVSLENRFIHAYQSSGEAIEHYVAYLQEMAAEHGYVYGTHYLPHDAKNKSLQTGKSLLELLYELLPGHTFEIVPRVEKLLVGIQQARSAFSTCWFDKEECSDGLAAIEAYRKRFNIAINAFTNEPVHDMNSNFADAYRQFAQSHPSVRRKADSESEFKRKARQRFGVGAGKSPMRA